MDVKSPVAPTKLLRLLISELGKEQDTVLSVDTNCICVY